MADFLDDMPNGAELTGLLAYLQQDDEVKANWTAYAIAKALGGDRKTRTRPLDDDDEEVIDTTQPEFAQNFKGFVNTKPQMQRMPSRQAGTQILMG